MKHAYSLLQFLLLFAVGLQSALFAQTGHNGNIQGKDWLEMIQDPDVEFYTVQKRFNEYWQNRSDYKGNGWKVFKRWEYINQYRVLANGRLQPPGYVFDEYNRYISEVTESASGNWSLQGPSTYVGNNTAQPTGMGRVNAIAFHPTDASTIFIGSPSGGFWKTTNGGTTWSNLSNNLPTLGVSSILVHPTNPDIIYIGSGDRDSEDAIPLGVFKTTNGGVTWTQINSTMGNVTVGAMLMHPSDPNTIIAATSGGIYKTTNGGSTWSQTASGIFKDLQFKPGDPAIVYAVKIVSPSEFYRSTNTGSSWTKITSGIETSGIGSRMVIGVSAANANYVYLLQIKSTDATLAFILRSTDGGQNFSQVASGPNILGYNCDGSGTASQANYDLCMTVDPNNVNNVFAGGINNWKSSDAGANWTISSHWIGSSYGNSCASTVHADQHCYAWSPLNGRLYVGHDGGIHYTADGGTTWTEITNNLAITQIYKIGQGAGNVNYSVFGCQDNGCAATTNGSTFNTTSGGDGMECLIDYNNSNYCYNTYYGGITRRSATGPNGSYSVMAGNGYNGIDESGAWVSPYFLHKSDPNTMFLGLKNVWRSNNVRSSSVSLISWSKISSGETGDCIDIEQSGADLNIVYAARATALKRTDNANAAAGSVTWTTCALPGGTTPTDIEAHPSDASIVYATAGYKIYKSSNKGMTWTDISGNLPSLFINCLVIDKNASEGIYIGNQTGVWYKDATLTSWALFSSGLPPVDVRELEIYYDYGNPSNNRIKCGTYGRGLWQSDLMKVNTVDPSGFTATPVSLSQVNLAWTRNPSNDNVIIATSSTTTFGVPADGESYTAGNTLPGGGGTVIYNGSLTSYNHSSLSAGVTYYYKIWSVNGSLQYSAGLPPVSATTYTHGWTSGAGSSDWFTAGNWGAGSVPTQSDNVYIPSGTTYQPQINAAGATCGNLRIETGATLTMNNSTGYTLSVAGDWINDGTFTRGIGTVDFNNPNIDQTIKGNSATDFYILKVTKGSRDRILEATSIITLNAPTNPLDIASGTFKLSSASTITPFTSGSGSELFSTDGFWNNGGTVNGGSFNMYNAGLLRISGGTMNVGTGANNHLIYWNGGRITMEGGTLQVAGALRPNSGSSTGTYTQTGGIVTVNTVGSTATDRAPFEINSGVAFIQSGGTVVIQKSSSHATADVIISSTSNTVTGGTLQIGNASTPAGQTIRINSTVPVGNLTIGSTNSPVAQLVTNGLTVLNDVTISGGTLNANNLNMNVGGQWINNGTFSAGSGSVSFTGSATQSIGGSASTTFHNLTVNGTDITTGTTASSFLTTVGNSLTINTGKKLTIPSSQNLTVNGTVTNNAGTDGMVVKSDATGTGSLIQSTAGVSATIERYMNNTEWSNWQDGWHFLGSPVVSQAISPAFTTDPYDFYCWYEPANTWVNYKNTSTAPTWNTANGSTNFTVGKGYMAAYDNEGVHSFSGILNVDDVSITGLTITGSSQVNRSWHLLGNPYASALTWDASAAWNLTNIGGVAKIWNEANQSYSDITSTPSSVIPATNGFMVQVSSGTGSLTIPASKRVHSSQSFYKSTVQGIVLTVRNQSIGNAQESAVYILPEATDGFDAAYDCQYFQGYGPGFYSWAGQEKLSTNSLPVVALNSGIEFDFLPNGNGNYTLTARGLETLQAHAWLRDKKTGEEHDLTGAPSYAFTAEASDVPGRFRLHFSGVGMAGEQGGNSLTVTLSGRILRVTGLDQAGGHCNLTVYNMLGQKVFLVKDMKEGTTTIPTELSRGVYLVTVKAPGCVHTEKIFIQ